MRNNKYFTCLVENRNGFLVVEFDGTDEFLAARKITLDELAEAFNIIIARKKSDHPILTGIKNFINGIHQRFEAVFIIVFVADFLLEVFSDVAEVEEVIFHVLSFIGVVC